MTPEQFEFIGPRWKAILDSLFGDERLVGEIEASDEYAALFGGMSINEAIDRFECMIDPDPDDEMEGANPEFDAWYADIRKRFGWDESEAGDDR
jgi:hypothetical protein